MSIKNKIFGVLMAAAVSVTSFGAVISVKADMYQQTCYKCGQESLFSEAVGSRQEDTGAARLCEHGYANEANIERNCYEKRRFYCGDCDISWEDWFYIGTYWYCTHNNAGH